MHINFIPPFVLTKILTFGVISRYYGLLKQNDRQDISKYFKISDKLLKQILANLTMVRNISAHSDRLFCYRNKYYISFKNIDKNYPLFFFIISLTTSPTIISPTTDGTNETLPGTCFLASFSFIGSSFE